MKLSLITSSLIALSAAAPAFEERRAHPAGLRSPLHNIKRAIELNPPVVSPVAVRSVSQGGVGDEVEESVLEERFVRQGGGGVVGVSSSSHPRVKARSDSQGGDEVEESVLEERFVRQGGGGVVGVSSSSHPRVKARSDSQGGDEVEESVLEERFVRQGGGGVVGVSSSSHPRVKARENHGRTPQGHKNGFPQGSQHVGNQGGNPGFNLNFNQQQQKQPQFNHGGNSGFNFKNFQGNQFFNPNSNSQNGFQFGQARVLINGQEARVLIGQPTLVSVNGPQIFSLSTDQGGCLPFSVANNGQPGSAIIQAAFGVGRNFQAGNGINPILVNNQQILVWCSPNSLPLNFFQGSGF